MDIYKSIYELLAFAEIHLGLTAEDRTYCKNKLFKLLDIYEDGAAEIDTDAVSALDSPAEIIRDIVDYAVRENIVDQSRESLFDTEIADAVCPRPSEIAAKFASFRSIKKACDWFYDFCIKCNYIRLRDVSRNKYWLAEETKGKLEITINLSKPEKSNKDIAAQGKAVSAKYPKCALCKENVGFCGTGTHPARQNLRTLPLKLAGEEWFWQFSPYVYYYQHCIAVNNEHIRMNVEPKTLQKLLDFTDALPHYFVGCNASLPIVGGSILSHDHFQGGGKLLPMHKAKIKERIAFKDFETVEAGILDWYNSAVRLSSADKQAVYELGKKILLAWQGYSDISNDIIAFSGETPHNTLTPVARKTGKKYCLELILRNNRTDEAHPDGIFHAHKEYHNIKSEGIGLIEAMGLFVLPARLDRQNKEIAAYLSGAKAYSRANLAPDMLIHADMIERLLSQSGGKISHALAEDMIVKEINRVCEQILINTAVFKPTDKGRSAFKAFLQSCT